ncbi:MAG: 50S ribosomal protein L29 [Candidatus Margulisiibacteriota bacterium]|nr:MAG: 50S ribosomal protein L29 [Candidatus Margulisbacteria bacterium GWD2_39_127]OGI04633.1 MAG: 50S ribosomal protein L29 [Candidatus Margulisbacteria bacterium GWF2_38_17]OGI11835.1 MAG: 50S ribosomal protein L29 [Candidatus Margulisbacteria bacterium GWE2_39_32]PZM79793.1 MAG: 50S ribosomal protein L29 [Candidatus Margulisiibacteriota bacterium]HAR62700.1 50S ribosomal protein L29 [Candidatus Margulisiibacteriota bacterium]
MTTVINDLLKSDNKELKIKLEERYKELIIMKFKLAASQLKDTSIIKKTKKEIARINTVLKMMNRED